jgi:hypothetical protein
MRKCFQDVPIGQRFPVTWVSVDLENHTKLQAKLQAMHPAAQGGAMVQTLYALREYVQWRFAHEQLCYWKWYGDGGEYAAHGDHEPCVRAVKACLSILDGWIGFVSDGRKNATHCALTLRLGIDTGTFLWEGETAIINGDALDQAVKLQQALKLRRRSAVKFAITAPVYQPQPPDIKERFVLDRSLTQRLDVGDVFVCTTRVVHALPSCI